MDEKPKSTFKIKRRCRLGGASNFLQQKRGLPYYKAKNKIKMNNWLKQMEKLEQNIDFDIVKENCRHFFHLNLEDNNFDKELYNLEHLFTPMTFWFLINDSYFQKNTIKERMSNLIKEFEINKNSHNNILILQEDSDNVENNNILYKNGYKYNSFLSDVQDIKIKSDFFRHIKSLIEYSKENEIQNSNNDIENNVNNNEVNSLEKNKELINNLINKFHDINEKKIQKLKNLVDKIELKEKNNNEIDKNYINNIKISPLFDHDNESLLARNKFIDYIQKKEKIKNKTFEENKKIFSFSEKFINLKDSKANNNEFNNIEEIKENHNRITDSIISLSKVDSNNFNSDTNNTCNVQIENNITINKENINMIENKSINYKIAFIKNHLINPEEKNSFMNKNICCVCNNGDVEPNQFLLKCEKCYVTVHQNCYGAQVKELFNWVCDACNEMSKEEVYNLECFLCPVKGGAFKKIELPIESIFYKKVMDYKHNKIELPKNNYNIIIPKKDYNKTKFAWAHLSCALWNPNINLKCYEKKTGIYIENITYKDFNSFCSLCKKNNSGPTIKCNNEGCECYFHPECARINNCCLEVEIINKEYQYNVYCYKHKPNLLAKKINTNCKNEIRDVILVNHELNNIYDLYKKIYKNDFYQRPKIINEIEIENCTHSRKHKKHKSFNFNNPLKIKKIKISKNKNDLKNIIINLTSRGRKRKIQKNINLYQKKNINYNSKKLKTHNLKKIIITNNMNSNTIINNIGNGNNINIYVSNYSNIQTNFDITNSSKSKKYGKDSNTKNYPIPTIEINKKEFDKLANNNNTNFDLNKYINDKEEFIIYLIGFLNDYTLKNRIIIKKKNNTIDKRAPIYYLKYQDFENNNIPWGEIGYKNLTSSILRKSFFEIFSNENLYKHLFLDRIDKTLKDLKKNKKFEKYTIECDNKEKCIGAINGVYNLLSLDCFKYKILDEKHFFPKSFVCQACINNIPNSKISLINNNIKHKKDIFSHVKINIKK